MTATVQSDSHPRGEPRAGTPPRPRRSRRRWAGAGFIAPFLAVFALVFLAPIVYSIYLSLFRERLIGGNSFVGLDNYADVLQDDQFWTSLTRVALFLAIQVPIMLGIALAVALAIDSRRLFAANLFRITVFLPYAVPAVVATLMWGFMYGSRFGLVGSINENLGLSLPDRSPRIWCWPRSAISSPGSSWATTC
jgi:multiple sugar transport system permease protein